MQKKNALELLMFMRDKSMRLGNFRTRNKEILGGQIKHLLINSKISEQCEKSA